MFGCVNITKLSFHLKLHFILFNLQHSSSIRVAACVCWFGVITENGAVIGRFGFCVYLALGVSVVVPLLPSYKYARQAGPLVGGGVMTSSNGVKDKGDPTH